MSVELEIFKAGSYPQGEFTVAQLQEMADAYDPALHEAPLVIGHKTNTERAKSGEPAHGWVKRLWVKGESLMGEVDQISDDLKKNYREGRYKKWSAEIYPAFAPKGGKMYLKAVAFLGAASPAVKGLAPATFKDDTDSIIIPQEGKTMPEPITAADLEKSEGRIMAFLKGIVHKFSDPPDDEPTGTGEDAPPDIKSALDNMSNPEIAEVLDAIADHPRAQEVAASLEQEEEEAHLAELEKNPDHKFRVETTKKGIGAWVDAQIKSGRLNPAAKDAGIVNFMEMLAFADSDADDGTIKFSEKGEAMTPLAMFQHVIEKHVMVPTGEAAPEDKGEKKAPAIPINMNFNERTEGRTKEMVDPDSVSFAEKAQKYAKDNKVSLSDAMIALRRA